MEELFFECFSGIIVRYVFEENPTSFFLFSLFVGGNAYAAATIVGGAIMINDGTEANPYSILDVVSDINNTNHIQRLNNGVILVLAQK